MSALSPIRTSLERRRAPKLSPEKRREQLLRCALTVFARRGIGSARHAEIAQEAQVAVPTVFTYFPTREILVREVLSEVDQYLSQVVWSAIGAGNSVFEKLLLTQLQVPFQPLILYSHVSLVIQTLGSAA